MLTTARTEDGTGLAPPPESARGDESVRHAVTKMFGRDSIYVAMWGMQLATAALVTPVTTRVLGPARFGAVAAAIAIMQVVFAIATMGLQTAIQRHFAEPDGDAKARRVFMLAIALAAVCVVLVDMTGPTWAPAVGFDGYSGPVRLAVLWAGIAAVTDAGLGLLRSLDKLAAFSTVTLLQSVVAQTAALMLVLTVERSATLFVLGLMVGQVLALVVCVWSAPPRRLRVRDTALVSSALRYAVPLVPSALGAFVLNTSDRLVVQRYLGVVDVGRYQIAYNIGALSITLLAVLNTAWMPRVFALRDESSKAQVLAAARDAVRVMLFPVLLGLSVAAPVLLRIWGPPSFRPDDLLIVVVVVVVSSLPFADSLASTRVLLAGGQTWPLAMSYVVAAVLNVALNVLLVPVLGLAGSALATLVAYVVLSAVNRLSAARVLRVPDAHPLIITGMAVVTAASVGSVLLPTTPQWLVARMVLGLACLFWFGRTLRRLATGDFARRSGGRRRSAFDYIVHDGQPTGSVDLTPGPQLADPTVAPPTVAP